MNTFIIAEGQADPLELEIETGAKVENLAARVAEHLNLPKDELLVFVEGRDEPLTFDAVVKEVAPGDGCFHVHRCHHVAVAVSYNRPDPIAGDFRPNTMIGRLREWAVHEFKIHPNDAAYLRLQLKDGAFPSERAHVGQFASHSHCGVVFRLAEHKKPQG